MSVEAMALVLHHADCSGTEKVVLLGIANHDGDGGAWPAIATLAKYACVSERSVQNAISALNAKGLITVHLQAGGTADSRDDRRPNRYEINLACPESCDRTTKHGVKKASPRGGNGVKLATERGEGGYRDGVKVASPEPSSEPPRESSPTTPAPTDAGAGEKEGFGPHEDHPGTEKACCLVAAWYRGAKDREGETGERPLPTIAKRMRGQATNMAKDLKSPEDWTQGISAAYAAGCQGLWDLAQGAPVHRAPRIDPKAAEQDKIFASSPDQLAKRAERDAKILAQREAQRS